MVCKLKKAFVWLKQYLHAWFGQFSQVMIELLRYVIDQWVFYKKSTEGTIFLIVYVDDIIIINIVQKGMVELKDLFKRI